MAPVTATASPNAAQIWRELLSQGATPVQAAGIMANMWFESRFNPEANAIDSNGLPSVGLVQWNNNKTAQALLTGNVATDIKNQIAYLVQSGGLQAASGTTPGDTASNFAHNYEKCAACGYQSGSSELASRASIASPIYTAGISGTWGSASSTGSAPGSNAGGNILTADTADTNPCYIKIPVVGGCLFRASWGRALLGGSLIAAGGMIILVGTALLIAKHDILPAVAKTGLRRMPIGGIP